MAEINVQAILKAIVKIFILSGEGLIITDLKFFLLKQFLFKRHCAASAVGAGCRDKARSFIHHSGDAEPEGFFLCHFEMRDCILPGILRQYTFDRLAPAVNENPQKLSFFIDRVFLGIQLAHFIQMKSSQLQRQAVAPERMTTAAGQLDRMIRTYRIQLFLCREFSIPAVLVPSHACDPFSLFQALGSHPYLFQKLFLSFSCRIDGYHDRARHIHMYMAVAHSRQHRTALQILQLLVQSHLLHQLFCCPQPDDPSVLYGHGLVNSIVRIHGIDPSIYIKRTLFHSPSPLVFISPAYCNSLDAIHIKQLPCQTKKAIHLPFFHSK